MLNTYPTRSSLHPNKPMRFRLSCPQSIPQQVRLQEASGLNRTETKRFATHTSYHVAIILASPTPFLNALPRASFPVVVVFVTRISGTIFVPLVVCRLELSTANPCRRHLHFHTVGYFYKYLGVAMTIASNVVA